MNNDKKLGNIIEALSQHADESAVSVLERLGTNCSDDEVRSMTARALINRNTKDSLEIVIAQAGKGINDLNTSVVMNSINGLLALENKENVLAVLNETETNCEDESVRETARSVKTLISLS